MVPTPLIIAVILLFIASLITLVQAERLDVSDKEPVVNALVAYMITRKWLPLNHIEELARLEWADEVTVTTMRDAKP